MGTAAAVGRGRGAPCEPDGWAEAGVEDGEMEKWVGIKREKEMDNGCPGLGIRKELKRGRES